LGHVAPSPTTNNRYTKITVLADHVRVSYTVFFGELPGTAERRRMDTNADGALDPRELQTFGDALLAEVAPDLKVTIDGRVPRAAWTVSDVGLGTPTTQAGAFSVDLTLVVPVADPRAASHEIRFADGWAAPSPGETEVRVEESPGVRVTSAHRVREARGLSLRFVSQGRPKPDDAVLVKISVDPTAPRTLPALETPRRKRPLVVALLVLGAAAIVGLALWAGRAIGTRRGTSPPRSGPSTS
jgi:hypothetical protein